MLELLRVVCTDSLTFKEYIEDLKIQNLYLILLSILNCLCVSGFLQSLVHNTHSSTYKRVTILFYIIKYYHDLVTNSMNSFYKCLLLTFLRFVLSFFVFCDFVFATFFPKSLDTQYQTPEEGEIEIGKDKMVEKKITNFSMRYTKLV